MRIILVSGLCLGALLPCRPVAAAVSVVDLGGKQYQVTFRFTPDEDVRTVHVAGSFNGWNPTARALERSGDDFTTSLQLAPGRYEYKFVINGADWRTDVDNPNRSGGYQNALLVVGADLPAAPPQTPPPLAAAVEAPHPPPVRDALTRLAAADDDARTRDLNALLEHLPMPYFTDETVTFLWAGDPPEPPTVQLYAAGVRLGHALSPVSGVTGLFAATLQRRGLPERWAYVYVVERGGRTVMELDPHGWSVTTRDGVPATRGVAASDRVGRIELIRDVGGASADVPPRDVYVYLPPGYPAGERRYPVLYMHDGQNCWDDPESPFGHGGWGVNLLADRLIGEGAVEPFLVVGVANTAERMREYGPGPDMLTGEGHAYLHFLKDALKPLIDARYRTAPEAARTLLAGSSLGGAISLEAALLWPEVYGGAACLSPALMFKDDAEHSYTDLVAKVGKRPVRLYVDNGTAGPGGDGAERTEQLVAALRAAGWRDGEDLVHFVDAGAEHNEAAWRSRFDRALLFLLGRNGSAGQR